MNLPDPPPRMPPVRQEELTDDMRAFLKKWAGGIFNQADSNPVLLTFAYHPTLADLFSQFNIHLLSTNTLPVRLRQIAIMLSRVNQVGRSCARPGSARPRTCGRAISTPAFAVVSSRPDFDRSKRARTIPTSRRLSGSLSWPQKISSATERSAMQTGKR